MDYILMTVSIIFAAANSLILRQFRNRTFKTTGDVFFFNGGVSLVWTVTMALWSVVSGDCSVSVLSVVFGVVYGAILCLFLYFKTEALANGPVSLTTLIGSCAFIIATGFGVLYAAETVSVSQIIGMSLIMFSLILCINPQKSAEKLSVKWFVYCFAFFLAGGLVGIFYKIFGASAVANQVNSMMLSASVSSCVLFFLLGVLVHRVKQEECPRIDRGALLYILLSGVTGCLYIRLNISLSAVIPAAVFFPVSNGALVIISTVAGAAAFGERLSKVQFAGILLGLLAIVIIGCADTLFALLG